jgi:hypothetical protein
MAHTLARAVQESLRLHGYNDRDSVEEIERDSSSEVAARVSAQKRASA